MSDINELKRIYFDKKTRISGIGQKIPVFCYLLIWAVLFGLMAYLCFTAYHFAFIILGLLFALFAYLSFRSLRIMRKVYADENYMYVKNGSEEEKIPLERIYAGSKPFVKVFTALEAVKFYYTTNSGEKKVVKFVPAQLNHMYNQFIDAVAAKNANVKIKRSIL